VPKSDKLDYRITRSAKETKLQDSDFAFVFNDQGDIRAIQLNINMEDEDVLPYVVERMIAYVNELDLLHRIERTYH
jgi:hypothetical protein